MTYPNKHQSDAGHAGGVAAGLSDVHMMWPLGSKKSRPNLEMHTMMIKVNLTDDTMTVVTHTNTNTWNMDIRGRCRVSVGG